MASSRASAIAITSLVSLIAAGILGACETIAAGGTSASPMDARVQATIDRAAAQAASLAADPVP